MKSPQDWLPVRPFLIVLTLLSIPAARVVPADPLPNPCPRAYHVGEAVQRWEFQVGTEGWRAQNQCSLDVVNGVLVIHSTGGDPYLSATLPLQGSQFAVRLRMRSETGGNGQIFWSSNKHPGSDARRQASFELHHDGQWHEYTVPLEIDGDLTALRLDPGTAAGQIEVDWIAVHRGGWHPLEITRLNPLDGRLDIWVRNHSERHLQATVNGVACDLAASAETQVTLDIVGDAALLSQHIRVESPGLTPIERRFWTYAPEAAIDAIEKQVGDLTIHAARDGSVLRIERGGQQVAALAPLAQLAGALPSLKPRDATAWPLVFEGDGVRVTLGSESGNLLTVAIDSQSSVEGPVVRTFGGLEQGLLAGVEYLGRGEHSSSRLDIETAEHLRVEPDPMHLTMPLMAFVTDRASVAMVWDDTSLQPTFAAPDFVDYAPGHRMSLKGKSISAVLRVADGWPDGGRLEEVILWAVQHRGGLPPLPELPRSFEEQMQLSLAAYHGLILDSENGGWFHAVVPGARRMPDRGAPLGDCASAIYRITGQMPTVDRLQLGGAHVRNSTSFFVSGRAEQWLRIVDGQAESLRRGQQPDGSYRYDGEYRRGHFENTASGICARPAYILLEHAYFTGNQESLAAGLKALQYIQRFRTPRGAQTWEVPLHTPDILASAHLVWAYVRAYELTGDAQHLEHARRWALTGLPFVYQWSNRPIMAYATIAVYGATNWQAPNWIGLPVQWCGTVYAYALLLLAPHDKTLDWRQLAEGILICGEQMQYPDGPSKGCLPDVFQLPSQRRLPADINPGALVSLRLQIAGLPEDLSVGVDEKHRVVSPYPVALEGGMARISARKGLRYQVLIDGTRIVDVESQGEDVISIDAP